MQLKLIENLSPTNVVDKVFGTQTTLTIHLKRTTDISNPELVLMAVPGVEFTDYNYAQIVELGRFYFVESVENMSQSLWKISLRCDVLSTYKTQVRNSLARYRRGLKTGDYYVGDIEAKNVKTITKHFSDVTLTETHSNILTVVEGGKTNGN